MNCKGTVEMLSAYLDRELGHDERDAVRAHLANCDRCRTEERDLRSLKGLLLGVKAPEPAPDFERRLMSRLHEQVSRSAPRSIVLPRLRPLVWGQIGGFAATAALGAVVLLGHGSRAEIPLPTVVRSAQTVAQNFDPEMDAQHSEAYWSGGDYSASPLMPTSYGP